MIAAGAWLDVLLAGALAAALAWLFRGDSPAPRPARGLGGPGVAERLGRLRTLYPRLLRQSGFVTGAIWLGVVKVGLAILLPFLVLRVAAMAGFSFGRPRLVAAVLAGFFLADLTLFFLRRRRRKKVFQALPYFLDLLVAFLQSGLSLVDAFRRAGREGFSGPHPLAREVALIGRELDVGQQPIVAFQKLGDRTGVPELNAVAAALRMGVRLGATVQSTLGIQAETMWIRRRENALKQIHKAEIQVMFPVMLAGFPVFAVLAMFPLIMDLIDAVGDFEGLF